MVACALPAEDHYPSCIVEGYGVGLRSPRSPHDVVGGEDVHAAGEVAQGARPVLLGAYEVALYLFLPVEEKTTTTP